MTQFNLKKFDNWWMPEYERHLPGHMRTVNQVIYGRLSYQYGKYTTAIPYIKNMRTVIDVGGHIGLWSYFLSKDFADVKAFEPMEIHRQCFAKNLIDAHNVELLGCALGEVESMVDLETRTPDSSGDTQVDPESIGSGKTPMKPLDWFGFEDVDLIKIDCEGFEEFVLRGAVETLEKWKPCVIVEQKRDMSARYGLEKQSAVKFLEDLGAVMRQEISGDFIMSWD